jgi:hypothetical protein
MSKTLFSPLLHLGLSHVLIVLLYRLAIQDIDTTPFHELDDEYEQLIAILSAMEKQADKFCS